jgi:6-pyruvoyltetrahydropterin/6-carboxytetrahydropterin synthase
VSFLPLNHPGSKKEAYLELTGFSFEAAHLTYTKDKGNYGLHGHSFEVKIRVWGTPDPETYIIIDVSVIKKMMENIVRDFDHKVIIGEKQSDLRSMLDRFNLEYIVIPYPQASMEALSQHFCRIVWEELRRKYDINSVEICVSQGFDEYACYRIGDS